MKALILNSGWGRRMGAASKYEPKCMTALNQEETIVSRQLRILNSCGIKDIVMTTGLFAEKLTDYCNSMPYDFNFIFVNNPLYEKTNYIYSMYLAGEYLNEDFVLLHGDLVFEKQVLQACISNQKSNMVVSSEAPLPEKDFKAEICNQKIGRIGTDFFENAVAAQPMYFLRQEDWKKWKDKIEAFVKEGKVNCYAEDALNEVICSCNIVPNDIGAQLCVEIDTAEDRTKVMEMLKVEE